jgi:hypothetical protein
MVVDGEVHQSSVLGATQLAGHEAAVEVSVATRPRNVVDTFSRRDHLSNEEPEHPINNDLTAQ